MTQSYALPNRFSTTTGIKGKKHLWEVFLTEKADSFVGSFSHRESRL